jgi:putative PIG3 family NAD(P)H quinone oxidoreductase
MKAIIADTDAKHTLHWQNVPDPTCGPHEVLVDIHATAVNRADLLQRAGQYPPPPGTPPYMGLEMSGTITQVGDAVATRQPGDRVLGLLSGGGYAEQVAVPATHLLPLPDDRDFTWGAAVCEVFLTAFVNLFIEANLQRGETALVHGGASGVGTAAIQLCREAGAVVIATAGTAAKVARCLELGATAAINYKERDFAEAILAETDGVDVILDIAGADYLERNLHLLRSQGRLVVIAVLGGSQVQIDLLQMMRKRLRLIGSVLRSRSDEEKTAIVESFKERFWPALVAGRIQTVVETVLPIERAAEAHQILSENRNIGKVILQVHP